MSRVKHGRCGTPEYSAWQAMKARCKNPNNPRYPSYGGRGIFVCERWEQFEAFFEDMGPRPVGGTLERVDNNSGYCPENCKWVGRKEQDRNRRTSRWVIYEGWPVLVPDLASRFNIDRRTLHSRIFKYRWPVEKAVSTPVRPYGG
jgi:hypothetical protein